MLKGIGLYGSSRPAQRQKYYLGQWTFTGRCLHPKLAVNCWDVLVLLQIFSKVVMKLT